MGRNCDRTYVVHIQSDPQSHVDESNTVRIRDATSPLRFKFDWLSNLNLRVQALIFSQNVGSARGSKSFTTLPPEEMKKRARG